MTDRLRVLHVCAPAQVGGLESVVAALAGGLADRGHEIHAATVVEPATERPEFVNRMARRGVSTRRIEVAHRRYLTEARRLSELVADVAPDVVHSHGYRPDVVAGVLSRRLRAPLVSTVHGFTGGGAKNRFYEWLQCLALRRFEAVAAVSGPLRRELLDRGLEAARVHLVRNAWSADRDLLSSRDARSELGLPADAFVVGWVGRLSPEKGPDVFLDALAELGSSDADLVASVVGDGALLDSLRTTARRSARSGSVHFHGRVPGAAAVYRAFDVFVLSSRSEGTPVSLLEAMAAEVPVVATRVGGVPDVVRHEREALLVAPEDPSALAAAIERLREDRELGRALARRARGRLEAGFSEESWIDRYEALYGWVTAEG